MIDNDFLEKWVPVIVPEEFGPNPDPLEGKHVLEIVIVPDEEMNKSKDTFELGTFDSQRLFGHAMDIGGVMSCLGKDRPHLKNKFVIRLNQSMSEVRGVATLAHELGHVHGFVYNPVKHLEDKEKYADEFAVKLIKERIGDKEIRAEVLAENLFMRPERV